MDGNWDSKWGNAQGGKAPASHEAGKVSAPGTPMMKDSIGLCASWLAFFRIVMMLLGSSQS